MSIGFSVERAILHVLLRTKENFKKSDMDKTHFPILRYSFPWKPINISDIFYFQIHTETLPNLT